MKPYIFPALTALIGFSAAWALKPEAKPSKSVTSAAETSPSPRSSRLAGGDRSANSGGKNTKQAKNTNFPLADQLDSGPKTRDEARMLRLTEALGLAVDQQGAIIRLIEEAQAKPDETGSAIQDITIRGKIVEEGLAQILTPEQLAKFEEMRLRERENRVEQRALRSLIPALEDIDLSPEERDQVLARLRQKARADMQTIPAAATLLLDKSMLPTNNKELSVDGILTMAKMAETPDPDPMVAHQNVMNANRQELEDLIACFDGLLSPGQMGQYQAGINESRELMKKMQVPRRPVPEPPGINDDTDSEFVPDDLDGGSDASDSSEVE